MVNFGGFYRGITSALSPPFTIFSIRRQLKGRPDLLFILESIAECITDEYGECQIACAIASCEENGVCFLFPCKNWSQQPGKKRVFVGCFWSLMKTKFFGSESVLRTSKRRQRSSASDTQADTQISPTRPHTKIQILQPAQSPLCPATFSSAQTTKTNNTPATSQLCSGSVSPSAH